MALRKVGVDATSTTTKDNTRGQSNKAAEASTGEGTFKKGLVVEVLADPALLAAKFEEEENPFKEKIKNEEAALQAPRGSLLVKQIADGASETIDCVYPFFQTHVMLPIHVGEQVWLHEDGDTLYWLSRIAGSGVSEDVNYTHKDRDLETPSAKKGDAKEKADEEQGAVKRLIARFNNGAGGDQGGAGNAPKGSDTKSLLTNKQFPNGLRESVPRYTPKPGDLVLQGSNNTLIAFSTDRGWMKDDEEFVLSNSNDEVIEKSGTIDIVVGRGIPDPEGDEQTPSNESDAGTDPPRTCPRLMENESGEIETDKIAALNKLEPNQCEGDPDFHFDMSRIYVTMQSEIDKKLTLATETPILATGEQEDKQDAAIAMKSNEIRVVSRENGSIRIVKEKGEEGLGASIILNSDGTIHITGEKIFIGKSKDEGGQGEGPGEGNMQPYIKFSVMKEYLEDMHTSLDSFCNTMLTHTTPGYGAPSPQINAAIGTLQGELASHKAKIDKLQSERIFGE